MAAARVRHPPRPHITIYAFKAEKTSRGVLKVGQRYRMSNRRGRKRDRGVVVSFSVGRQKKGYCTILWPFSDDRKPTK